MAKLSSHSSSRTHRVILFGAPKTGKTELAGRLSEHFNLIWFDMENGHETLFKFPIAWQERIELIRLRDTPTYPIAIETVLKVIKKKPVAICESHGKVDCAICNKAKAEFIDIDLGTVPNDTIVVFDSLTQLTTSAINNICKKEKDDYKMKTDDWGNLAKLIEIFLCTIQDAGYNILVISHEIEAETEGKKKTLVPVGGSRNSSRNVAKAFDHVIYCERKNRKHAFSSSTTNTTTVLTGSRTDVEIETMEIPSLLAIFKPELYTGKALEKKATPASAILERMKAKAAAAAKTTGLKSNGS